MQIRLSKDLKSSILTLVRSGRFVSVDEAMNEAARLLLRQERPKTKDDLHRHLIEIGLMTRLPDSASDYEDPDDQPIAIEGEPLSETVIRERSERPPVKVGRVLPGPLESGGDA